MIRDFIENRHEKVGCIGFARRNIRQPERVWRRPPSPKEDTEHV